MASRWDDGPVVRIDDSGVGEQTAKMRWWWETMESERSSARQREGWPTEGDGEPTLERAMRYTTLLFDLDNTLFDAQTAELRAFDHALEAGGVRSPRRYLPTYVEINNALWAAVERQELTPNQVQARRFADLVEAARLDADPRVLADEYVVGMGRFGDLYPGARDVLGRLLSVATLALVTNGLGEVQRARIERLDLEPFFAAIVISGEVGTSKPGTGIFDLAFEALNRPDKRSALMIGDSLSSDIAGGANYGISTCWYNPQRKPADPAAAVDHEIVALDQLPDLAATGVVSEGTGDGT